MTYERERDARIQAATEDMIRMRRPKPAAVLAPDVGGPGMRSQFLRSSRDTLANATRDDLAKIWPVLEKHIGGALNDAPLWELLSYVYTLGLMHGTQLAAEKR